MGRAVKMAIGLYLAFAVTLYLYIFQWADTGIPEALKGTSADSATFMNKQQLILSEEYSEIRNFLFFLEAPFDWLFYFLVLVLGLSKRMENSARIVGKISVLRQAIYVFFLSLLSFIAMFPFNYAGHYFSEKYGISTQSFSLWMKDEVIGFWIGLVIMLGIAFVFFYVRSKSPKRWWLYLWMAMIPFTLFFMFVKPTIIDPLYNDFYPLKDKELEAKILAMAEEAGIPADHVFEVNMAEKTNAMNAYVTGIGANSRIVLWDTTLNKLTDEEILFIMAHEMAHYVEKHVYIGVGLYLVLALFGFGLTAKIMNLIIRKWGKLLRIESPNSLSGLLLFLCILSVLTFVSDPISNTVSRYQESRADRYALEMTNNKEAAVKTFQELSKSSLNQVNPPWLVKVFRYGHPTMIERISTAENYEEK
ncbi:M48 family metallopeptidase [Bacillus sp. AGMB 02131]|uniref:M48 family metallopeptidase n=1 Tax=Peribacillus faecalis TaxID=2772559 RepID=A0A927CYZ4_9BACI|nr:M48 family metallopeptidase [Peribacillus faecalis]MBD3110278.1 M48 family metallopeptidase [Peribacillus faecalis]